VTPKPTAAPDRYNRPMPARDVDDEGCGPGAGVALPDAPGDAVVAATVRLMKGFADPTRLRLLWLLRDGEQCVHVLVEALDVSQSAVSHQLRLLRDASLVVSRRRGRHVFYRLADDHVRRLLANAVSHGDEAVAAGEAAP